MVPSSWEFSMDRRSWKRTVLKALANFEIVFESFTRLVRFLLYMNRTLDQVPTVGFCGSGFIYGL